MIWSDSGDGKVACSICLQPEFQNRCRLDPCFHEFCFECISQWSRVCPKCPLCKVKLTSGIHDIHSDEDYQVTEFCKKSPSVPRKFSRTSRDIEREISDTIDEQHALALERRASIYQRQVFCKHIGSNPRINFHAYPSPESLAKNPRKLERIRTWVRRELLALMDCVNTVEFLVNMIEGLLKRYPIRSDTFIDALRPFLVDNTPLFVHELASFSRSSLDIATYDRVIEY